MGAAPRAGTAVSPPPPHRATTAHIQAVYPFVADGTLGPLGVYLGSCVGGAPFCYDPWDLYAEGVLTNPNLVVVGQIGRGKSTLVKILVWRSLLVGRQAWVLDPKGEYAPLAAAAGVEPLRLSPGGGSTLNPLATALSPTDDTSGRRRAEVLCSIAEVSLGRRLLPAERTAAEIAVTSAAAGGRTPTLPSVVAAMLDPDPRLAAAVNTDAAGLGTDGRTVALELRRLVEGDLAGMFDGPTSEGIDRDARLVVLDLSALYRSPALGILMTCAAAWLQSQLGRQGRSKRLVVVDEAWAILHDAATARWLQAGFKLARAHGLAHVAVVHRMSDLDSPGEEGSNQRRIAGGLLADSETAVVFAQPHSELAVARSQLGLSQAEAHLVSRLPRGVALWRVGDRSFVVDHVVSPAEAAFTDTDGAMR